MNTSATVSSPDLRRMGEIFEQMGYPVFFAERSADVPFDQVLVSLDEGENEAVSHVLRLYFHEDVLTHGIPAEAADIDDTATLQFFVEWQLPVPTSRLLDTYRLLNVFGRMVPIGSFGMVEDDELCGIYYRYTLMQPRDKYDLMHLLELLDVMRFYINRLMPQLVHWMSSEMALEAIIAQTEQGLVEMAQTLTVTPMAAT